ncbi:MAG: DVUA0089 family protein [Anaerolineae bacterium]
MQRRFIFALLLISLVALLTMPVAAQEDTARVRMGFFALDPNEYDLYINSKPAPEWGSGFANNEWMTYIVPGGWEYITCCSATPYFPMAAGTYSFAFTPKEAAPSDTVLGPIDITLEAGHNYSLAVVGAVEDGSLTIVPIDETIEFEESTPLSRLHVVLVNDVPGLPSVYMGSELGATVSYADYFTDSVPGGSAVIYDAYTDEDETTPVVRVEFPPVPAKISEFHVMLGPLPGSEDTRNRFSFNHGYPWDVTINEVGSVTVGEPLEGALSDTEMRNRYTLVLDEPATLNIEAHATGNNTSGSWGRGTFDSALYVYDSAGNLLFWNDEDTYTDDLAENPSSDAGIDALPLKAGTYFIDVGGFTDLQAGPYELTVEAVTQAAQEDTVQMRVGFFAFDPDDYDLYIDGQLSPVWGSGFANHEWMNGPVPSPWDYINCCSASPYLPIAAGDHRFAITPAGQDLNSAVFGPKDFTLESGHTYTLAVVGAVDDGSLNILPIDETVVFANADPATSFNIIVVNNIPGYPSVYLGGDLKATVDYADIFTTTVPGDTSVIYDVFTNEQQTVPLVHVEFPSQPTGLNDLYGLVGPLPGSSDSRDRFSFNHAMPGATTVNDRGEINVGETVNDTLPAPLQRNRYALTLSTPTTLHITATGIPETPAGSARPVTLDPILTVYDAQGHPLFWNDEDTQSDDWSEGNTSGAGIDVLPLEAGTYWIEVGGFSDLLQGPYELMVEAIPQAAQEDTARVRIGYFAFDPREYDTFVDGELASFSEGWDAANWMAFITPGTENTRVCCSATPYMDFPAGEHQIAFAPRGEGVEQAVTEPITVSLAPDHIYSLAIAGEIDDGSLTVLPIDETDSDFSSTFSEILINDLPGLDDIAISDWKPAAINSIPYLQSVTGWWSGNTGLDYNFVIPGSDNSNPTLLYSIPMPAGVSDLSAFTGSYPGHWGEDYIYAWNLSYPGEATIVQGDPLNLGEPVTGELTDVGQRVAYPLSLDTDQTINIYARVTGPTTAGWDIGYFDTMVYIYDDEGNLLFWNDDLASQVGVAGMEDLRLPAGNYVIQVGSFSDSMAGPYELTVESARRGA